MKLVLRQEILLLLAGVLPGSAGAFAVTRFMGACSTTFAQMILRHLRPLQACCFLWFLLHAAYRHYEPYEWIH